MLNYFPSWARCLSLAVILAGITRPGVAAGIVESPRLNGTYAGLILISQTGPIQASGVASTITITGSKSAPKISIAGNFSGTEFIPQTIKCRSNGTTIVSAILPGQSDFNQSVKGKSKTNNAGLAFTGKFDRMKKGGPIVKGTLEMSVFKANFNSTLLINSRVKFAGGTTIYVTIIALAIK